MVSNDAVWHRRRNRNRNRYRYRKKKQNLYKVGGGAPPRTPFIRVPLHAVAYNGTKRMIYFAF